MKTVLITSLCILSIQLALPQSMIVNKTDGSKATFQVADIENITFEDLNTFTDLRDSTIYETVKIGDQIWMRENLAYLPTVSPSKEVSDTTPFCYVRGYEGSTVSLAKANANYGTYGVLYNWPAVMNGASSSTSVPSGVQGICPSGWHLPSDAEWTVLTDYLADNGYGYGGSGSDIGKSMAAISGWTSNSIAGTVGNDQTSNNRSGFTTLPGGNLNNNGYFDNLGNAAFFCSSSDSDAGNAWYRNLDCSYDGVNRFNYYHNKSCGFSVRCLKD
jgi:uncharacterized protein (TIGR02145 family)